MIRTIQFRPVRAQPRAAAHPDRDLGDILVTRGVITIDTLDWARERCRRHLCTLTDILCAHAIADDRAVAAATATLMGCARVERADIVPDPAAIDAVGIDFCVRHTAIPLVRRGGVTPIAMAEPSAWDRARPALERVLGPVALVLAARGDVESVLIALRRIRLVSRAEARAPLERSCRTMAGRRRWVMGLALVVMALTVLILAPRASFAALAGLACFTLAVNTMLLLTAIRVAPAHRRRIGPGQQLSLARLPQVALAVPLFREREIAQTLIARLGRLTYPRELLDICLIVEECDDLTRAALAATDLPAWIRVIEVPRGVIQTKPRAMNYALDFMRGDIVGIYDAEDSPEPEQILEVVQQFAASPPHVACLQGRLNFYNPTASWITRCFTADYATWFCLILPALHRLGWPIPLGGTTVFFRRAALEAVGAWDAHNVTEDADLGMRLARSGYRTDLMTTTTLEEAVASARPWINQRSRWLKGYALTYGVHMRNPGLLWRELGAWRFLGMQVLFLTSLVGPLTAPCCGPSGCRRWACPIPSMACSKAAP